jgi:ankyrin repeat protein
MSSNHLEKLPPSKSSILSFLGIGRKSVSKKVEGTEQRRSISLTGPSQKIVDINPDAVLSPTALLKKRSQQSGKISSSPFGHSQSFAHSPSLHSSLSNSGRSTPRMSIDHGLNSPTVLSMMGGVEIYRPDPNRGSLRVPVLEDFSDIPNVEEEMMDSILNKPKLVEKVKPSEQLLRIVREGRRPSQDSPLMQEVRAEEILYHACLEGDITMVKELLSDPQKATLIHSKTKGVTPIHAAALKNQHEIIEYLLEKGTNINMKDKEERTPLHCACSADVKSIESVILLLGKGALVNAKDIYETTAFTVCVRKHKFELAETLLLFGADPNMKRSDGGTAIHEFMAKGNTIALEYILHLPNKKILTNLKDSGGETPFLKAVMSNQLDSLKVYFTYIPPKTHLLALNSRGLNCYHLCARHNLVDVFVYLNQLADGCGVRNDLINASDDMPKKYKPIHYAAINGHVGILMELSKVPGCDVNAKDVDGNTAIHLAIQNKKTDCVKVLLQGDAKLTIKNNLGDTAKKLLSKIK